MARTHWVGRVLVFVFLPLAISMTPASAQTTNGVTNGGTISSGTTAIITNPATSMIGAITNDGSLQFWQSTSLTNGFVISGPGSVSQRGSGTTIFSGANTYAGGTTNSAGTLSVGSSSALGTGTLTMNGGTFGVTGGGGWTLTRITNGLIEGINGLLQLAAGMDRDKSAHA